MLCHGPRSKNKKLNIIVSPRQASCHSVQCLSKAHLSCVIHLNLCDLPITGLAVFLKPGLPREEATHSKHPHARKQ